MATRVIVIGGGNAGLCAALAARDRGCDVLLLERAPKHLRGGNSRHTRNLRDVHDTADAFVTGAYHAEEFAADLEGVTGTEPDRELTSRLVQESATIASWMVAHGAAWQAPLRGTLHLSRTNHFFLGGGKALVNAYYDTVLARGIEVRYEADVCELDIEGGVVKGVMVRTGDVVERHTPDVVVAAAGGFEASIEWHRRYWGDAALNYVIRGTPHNDGTLLRILFDAGAAPVADPTRFHAIAVDARSPKFDGGIVTRLDAIPFSVVVNRDAERFADEGEDIWPKRYASWGRLIAAQPDQIAYAVFDERSRSLFMPSVYPPFRADSLAELASALDMDASRLSATIQRYNEAPRTGTMFDPARLDGVGTTGLEPPKRNWARRLEGPPFFAYPMRPGITFTYHGVGVDVRGRVVRHGGQPFENLVAAGEIMAGNLLTRGYLAGIGMTIGSVYGRIAGTTAAELAAS
jgi:tricarballylate dehydrogenase